MVTFDKSLLEKARLLFFKVYVDSISADGVCYVGSETATTGVRIRLWYTDWEYETETIVHTNEELEKVITDELADRVWEIQHGA